MSPFCKLADPAGYISCDWDLSADLPGRTWWVGFFKQHFLTILDLAVKVAVARGDGLEQARERAELCRQACHGRLDEYLRRPDGFGRVDILTLDGWRDGTLRQFGFPDAFIDVKDRENAKMLPLLPVVSRQLDGLKGHQQMQAVIQGVFAGNIFDLGSEATAKTFLAKSPDFFDIRAQLKPRPWLIDDYDRLVERLTDKNGYRKVVFFIDNAGSDFLLGALSMMRWLAQRGTRVVLAANELPTLNDMTIDDVRRWWPKILAVEPSLAGLPIELVSTGTAEPLIDLSAVSDELNAACSDADLVILEGMGRGVESNFDARFTCDALNIAMIKMEIVAKRMGGKVYDLVCRFR